MEEELPEEETQHDVFDESTIMSRRKVALLKRYINANIETPENPKAENGYMKFEHYKTVYMIALRWSRVLFDDRRLAITKARRDLFDK